VTRRVAKEMVLRVMGILAKKTSVLLDMCLTIMSLSRPYLPITVKMRHLTLPYSTVVFFTGHTRKLPPDSTSTL
jgi:hypothetical protein